MTFNEPAPGPVPDDDHEDGGCDATDADPQPPGEVAAEADEGGGDNDDEFPLDDDVNTDDPELDENTGEAK
jgi:hypothetical protein